MSDVGVILSWPLFGLLGNIGARDRTAPFWGRVVVQMEQFIV